MFIIQEMQTIGGQTALLPAVTKTSQLEADSEFYLKVGYAAISQVEVHTVIMYDEHGNVLNKKFYEHFQDAEPEPEPEGN